LNGIRSGVLDCEQRGYFVRSFIKISFSAFFSKEGLFENMHIPVMLWKLKDHKISRRFTVKLQLGKITRYVGRTETILAVSTVL